MTQLSVFAIISEGEVKNLIVGTFTDCNIVARNTYEDGVAVETWSMYYPAGTQIPVNIGDTYENGVFKRNGEVVSPVATIDQQTLANTTAIANNSDAIDDLIIAITPTEAN